MQMQRNISLRGFNTFGIDAKALLFVEPTSVNELIESISTAQEQNLPHLLLGGGSNILLTGNFEGTVIHPKILGIDTVEEDSDSITLSVGAGEEWDSFVNHTVSNGLGGVENLSLIPGSVGAAPIQNIGAYGMEVKDTIVRVKGINIRTLKPIEFTNTECQFGYRSSIFKQQLKGEIAITHVWFRLLKNPKYITHYGNIAGELESIGDPSLSNIRQVVVRIRSSKLPDPKELGNAGSFFKNPEIHIDAYNAIKVEFPEVPSYPTGNSNVKIPAGWLIEHCGWKGKRMGNVGVHSKQALVIVNYGGATGQEVLDLAQAVMDAVHLKFGVTLEMEVNVV